MDERSSEDRSAAAEGEAKTAEPRTAGRWRAAARRIRRLAVFDDEPSGFAAALRDARRERGAA